MRSTRTVCRLFALGAAFWTSSATADHLLLQVEDFEGPWRRQTNIAGYLGGGFRTSNANPEIARTTMTKTVAVRRGGRHVVWARGYTSENSRRAFQVQVGDVVLPRTHTGTKREWSWQRAGQVEVKPGDVTVVVRDADDGHESVDAILLTDQVDFDPQADLHRWRVYRGRVPAEADALRFTIDACSRELSERRDPSSKEGWETKRSLIRKHLAHALGLDPMPARTPLNVRVTGRAEREAYSIENVVFESRPKFYVTANVYVPKKVKLPAPAIVVVPGHAMEDGKNYGLYNTAELGLVRQGFIVLAYDPIGQGERRVPGMAHPLGYGSLLVGQTNEGHIVWDTIRSVDYLASRKDVDASRLGLAGNSGGGENTFYAMPFDERLKAGTSFCFVCSYDQWLRHGGNHCICNHLPGIVHLMEEFEIVGLNVPRAFLFGNGEKDRIFPIKGTRETLRRARQIYGLYGAEDRVTLVEAPLGHGWSKPLREACYGWMARWLQDRGDGKPMPEGEEKHEDPKSKDVLCLKDGKLPADAETVVTLNRKLADAFRGAYAALPTSKDAWLGRAGAWREEVWRCFGGRPAEMTPTVRKVDTFTWRDRKVEMLAIATEPGMEVAAALIRSKTAEGKCPGVVYLGLTEKSHVLGDPLAETLLKAGVAVLLLDPRGLGETFVHENHLTSDTVCLGRHIFAQRVWDVMQAARYLAGREEIDPKRIRCYGRGATGLLGLFAAALGAPLEAVSVDGPLASYRYFLEDGQPQAIWLAVPSLLKVIDVSQAAGLVAPGRLMIANSVGYGQRPLASEEAGMEFAFAKAAYGVVGAADRIRLVAGDAEAASSAIAAFLAGGGGEGK
ncbi:MAG: acetylxylan esterase [Phycisphaerae bacterium]|nr:acetylxylan esterase [Phycisphaerae bacterium]